MTFLGACNDVNDMLQLIYPSHSHLFFFFIVLVCNIAEPPGRAIVQRPPNRLHEFIHSSPSKGGTL